jgi:catalase (peroxidase I)
MSLEWRPKKVEASGNLQFEATDPSGDTLMMLPTDMALKTDAVFAQHARAYAADQVPATTAPCFHPTISCEI